MEQVTFARQVHSVWIESRTYGDIDYKKRGNWNSNNQEQRDRANLLFSRVEQCIYNLANDIDVNNSVHTGVLNEYVCEISDGIGRIIYEIIYDEQGNYGIIIKDFIWDYKTIPNSWWSIVENKKSINTIITETINNYLRRNIIMSSR